MVWSGAEEEPWWEKVCLCEMFGLSWFKRVLHSEVPGRSAMQKLGHLTDGLNFSIIVFKHKTLIFLIIYFL